MNKHFSKTTKLVNSMDVYGVISNGVHIDISKSLSATKKYANKEGYKEISIRYNGGYTAKIIEKNIGCGVWVSTDLNKRLSIYDNEGKTFDRYTIVDNSTKCYNEYQCIGADENGYYFFQWSSCQKGKHLGKRISFSDLSQELQNTLINVFNN